MHIIVKKNGSFVTHEYTDATEIRYVHLGATYSYYIEYDNFSKTDIYDADDYTIHIIYT